MNTGLPLGVCSRRRGGKRTWHMENKSGHPIGKSGQFSTLPSIYHTVGVVRRLEISKIKIERIPVLP